MNWPLKIKRARAALQLTQAEFADLVGACSGRIVRRWETGRTPARRMHPKIIAALKMAGAHAEDAT